MGLPRGVAATADLGRIVVKANEAVFVLSMRTGSFTSIETPALGAVVMTRPGVALIGSGAYGVDPQRNVLFDFNREMSVGLDLQGWRLDKSGPTPVLGSFGGRVLLAVVQADPDSGNVTTGVGGLSIEGVLDWVVPMEVSGERVGPLAPSPVFVSPARNRVLIAARAPNTPKLQHVLLTLVDQAGSVVESGGVWPADGMAIVGWWDADRVVAEDVATGLRVIGAPLAVDTAPFELFDDVAFENLRLAGDGKNALVDTASTLALVSQDGVSVWTAITSCEIRLSR
ncbi:MAG: hypothetical protein IIC71_08695 [Acidobacteria bacterium]|nr:hypothetical protein [Acidobacteriota bacterium]